MHAHRHRQTGIKLAVGQGLPRRQYVEAEVLLPGEPLKRDSEYVQQRILCRKRAAIEPIIGHLKHDFRLQRNWLKGSEGDKPSTY